MRTDLPIDLDPRRLFTRAQKAKIFARANGCCEICERKLGASEPWHAGHIKPHGQGGETVIENGRVECVKCGKETAAHDTKVSAKSDRQGGRTGQQARRARRKAEGKPPLIQNRGFNKNLRQKMNGKIERRTP